MLRCVNYVRFCPRGLCVLWLTLRRGIQLGITPPFFACFPYPYPDPLTDRIDGLGLSHRRAPMAIGDDIQHWYRMLTVRHPPFIIRSLALSPRRRTPGVYPAIGVFVPLVTRIGISIVSAPHDLMTYTFFSFFSVVP